ncbi:proliferation marker protein Ki-67 [Choloepus didactylus]|uniref:proliferation marker protein Ki-67 n=1 Tax=Choloepus didactylus TaxID=27675 RepID=UPI00189E849B|nr:proliferation marker protein Ki-67 [Choloepus didactylus]
MSLCGHLVIIKRSGIDGTHFPLRRQTCLFGRGTECDIRIQLPVVSKQHCKIEIIQQEVVLSNLSNTSPTQLNGITVYEPVKLKHGDIITIVDRSFRYECESHRKGIRTIDFPEQRSDQGSPRCLSRLSLSHDPDGKDQHPNAHSKFTEESILGRSPVPLRNVKGNRASDGSEDPVTRKTPQAAHSNYSPQYSEHPENNGRTATDPTRDFKEDIPRVTLTSCNQELKSVQGRQYLESIEKNESPFKKLYGSMKEELDVKLQKENVAQNLRKSGTQTPVSRKESVEGLHGERSESRLKSCRRSQKANPASNEWETTQMEERETNVEPCQISREAQNSSSPLAEMTKMKTPVQNAQPQNSSRKRKSKELSTTAGSFSVNSEKNEGSQAKSLTLTPSKLIIKEQTPVKVADTIDSGNTPKKLSSRRRVSSPSCAEVLPHSTEADLQGQVYLAKLFAQVERKIQNDTLSKPGNLNAKAGQMHSNPPNTSSLDISDFDNSISAPIDKDEEMSLKRRRVSFGGRLRPELFDENLPPNTPLKRGEIPGKRKSLGTRAPAVLKKIIKVQPQTPGKEESSEIRLEVTSAQNMLLSSLAFSSETVPPAAHDQSPTSPQAPSVSSGISLPPQGAAAKRGGRRSGSLTLKRRSFDKSKHDTLQMIYSKRQSGASEANLIVARSWADVVKLGVKKPQTKAVKYGHQRRIRRKRRANTPKKPANNIQNQFSTGHANSPCTIVIGKAHIEKVSGPAWPYRMLNTFVLNKKDCNEDFSGLTEMFKTPAKEKPQEINIYPDTVANSKILLEKEFQVTNSGEDPLLCPSENFENVLSSTQNVAKELSDKSSASSLVKTPEAHIMTSTEMKTPESEIEPLKVASSAYTFRRSTGLGNMQVLCTEMKNEKVKPDIAENDLGIKTPRKTPAKEKNLEGETKKSERPIETSKKNAESKDNSEKAVVITRSRRTSEQKGVPVEDPTAAQRLLTPSKKSEQLEELTGTKEPMGTPQRPAEPISHGNVGRKLQKTPTQSKAEPVESPASIQRLESTSKDKAEPLEDQTLNREVFQTPEQTEERINENEITKGLCKSPQQNPEPTDTPTGIQRLFKTPQKKGELVEKPLVLRKLVETPDQAKEPINDDKVLKTEQKLEPEEELTNSERLLKAPKEKAPPVEGLVIVEDHLQTQTPRAVEQPVDGDSVHQRLRNTPKQKQGPGEHLTLLKRLVKTHEGKADPVQELAGIREPSLISKKLKEQAHRKLRDTPEQKPESAESLMGFGRWPRTPEVKLEPMEELRKSPKHKKVSGETLEIHTRVPRTPKVTLEPAGDLASVMVFPQAPEQPEEPVSGDRAQRKLRNTPKRKPEPEPSQTGVKRLLRTPKVKPESSGELAGVTMFPQALEGPEKPLDGDSTCRRPRGTPERNAGSTEEDLQTPKQATCPDNESGKNSISPRQKRGKSENLTCLQVLFRTPEEKAGPVDDPTGSEESGTPPQMAELGDGAPTELKRASPEKSEAAEFLTNIKKLLRPSLRKIQPAEDLSGLKRPVHSPKAKGDQAEELTGVRNLMRTPKQGWGSTENLMSRKRFMKTPTKVHPMEDLTLLMATPNEVTEDVSDMPTILKTYAQEMLSTDSNISEKLQEMQLPTTPEITDVKNTTQGNQVMGKTLEHSQSVHAFQLKKNVDDLIELLASPKEHLEPSVTSELLKPARRKKRAVEDFLGIQRLMAEPTQKTPCLEIDYTGLQEMFDVGNKNQDGPGKQSQENASCNPPSNESKTGASKTEELLPENTEGRIVSQRTRYTLRKKSARKSPESEHLPSQTEHALAETNVKAELHLQEKPSRGMSLRSRHRHKTDTELQGSQLLTSAEKIEINKGEKTVKSFQEENSEGGAMKQKTVTLRSRGKSKPGVSMQESDSLASLTEAMHRENNDKPVTSLQEKAKSTNEEKMFLRSKKRIKTNFEEKTHPKTVMPMNNVQEKNLEDMEINQDTILSSSRNQSKKRVKLDGSNPLSDESKVADEEAEDKIGISAVKVLASTVGTQGTMTLRASRSRSKRNVKSEAFPSLPSTTKIPPTEEVEGPTRKTRKNVKDTALVTPGLSLRFRGSSKVCPTGLVFGTTNRMPVSKDEGKPEKKPQEEKVRSLRSGSGQKYPDPKASLLSTSDSEEFDKPVRKTLDKPKERTVKPEGTSLRTRYQTKFEREGQQSNSLPIISKKIPAEEGEKERRLKKHKTQTQDGPSMRSKSKANPAFEGLLSISSATETPRAEGTAKVPVKSQEPQEAGARAELRLRPGSRTKSRPAVKVQEPLPDLAVHASWEKDKVAGLRSSRLRKTNVTTPPSEIKQTGETEENLTKKIQAKKPEDPEAAVNQLCLRSRKVKILATETANKGVTLKDAMVSNAETSSKGPRHNQRAMRSARRCVTEETDTENPKQEKNNIQTKKMKTRKDIEDV